MKVLKFGGTSVGTVESLRNVKSIVDSIDDDAVVVVSALGGITDRLILTARKASEGEEETYRSELAAMTERHHNVIDGIVAEEHRDEIRDKVQAILDELERLYYGIYLVGDLSERVLDRVVSYGERLSSTIISRVIEGAKLLDSRQIIRTEKRHGRHVLANGPTASLVEEHVRFGNGCRRILMPGFISTDLEGKVTNLGRGGSDYTAAIIAAQLDADVLEIWTDVDGFMTADPRKIPNARIIDEMSFVEAMELCNFGAKVIYPPTIYPVFHKNIPIYIKNTFNPSAPGTRIDDNHRSDAASVSGISSINNTCLITVRPLHEGVAAERLQGKVFNAMARKGIDVLMSSLLTNSRALCFATKEADADRAEEELLLEFAPEIQRGEVEEPLLQHSLSTIALVGENLGNGESLLKDAVFALSQAGIGVMAASRGRSGSNVAVVVAPDKEVEALQTIHHLVFDIEN